MNGGVHREAQNYPLSAFPVGGVTSAMDTLLLYLPCVSIQFFAQSTACNLLKARSLRASMTPQLGDRILVLRPHWLNLILSGEKTSEIRGRNLAAGSYWPGCRGMIHGRAILMPATLIKTLEAWRDLRHMHHVEGDELPYKRTYGFPVRHSERVTPTPFAHPAGAVGIVKMR